MTATQAVPIVTAPPADVVRDPYVGLRDIHEGEPLYGREREVEELADTLTAERIVLCHAPSGAGKTSLIQARLIPLLRDDGFVVLGPTKVGREPDPQDVTANRYILSALIGFEQNLAREHSVAEQEVQFEPLSPAVLAELTITQYLDRREAALATGQRIVLIFDQFEEILTVDEVDVNEKTEFFRQVGAALRPLHRWALFVVREEYAASLDPYVHLVPTRLQRHYALELLEKDAATEAIARPAEAAGIPFTNEGVKKLVDTLRKAARPGSPEGELGRYVEPVLLQVVCRRLWTRLPPGTRVIGPDLIGEVGDVDTALAEYYAESVRSVSDKARASERAIRRWIGESLIRGNVRSQVEVGDEARYGLTTQSTKGLLGAYLIRLDRRRASNWYELAHDRLIAPIKANNENWFQEHMSAVEHYAETWYASARSGHVLLRGGTLRKAREWAAQHPDEIMSPSRVEEFLSASAARQHDRWREIWLAALILAVAVAVQPLWRLYRDRQREATWQSYGLTPPEIAGAKVKLYVTYLTRPQDAKIEDALRDLGYTLERATDATLRPSSVLPNQIKYGRAVDSTAIKLVALALMKADPGIRLQYICPEPEFAVIADSHLEVRYAKTWADSEPISIAKLRSDTAIRQKNGKVIWHCPR